MRLEPPPVFLELPADPDPRAFLLELLQSSLLLDPGVTLAFDTCQESAFAAQSSVEIDVLTTAADLEVVEFESVPQSFQSLAVVALLVVELLLVVVCPEESPQSSTEELLGFALLLGVFLPLLEKFLEEDHESVLVPQSSTFAVELLIRELVLLLVLPLDMLVLHASASIPHSLVSVTDGRLLKDLLLLRLAVVEAQAFVAAFQSSGSLPTGGAERETDLVALLQESAATCQSEAFCVPLDTASFKRNKYLNK